MCTSRNAAIRCGVLAGMLRASAVCMHALPAGVRINIAALSVTAGGVEYATSQGSVFQRSAPAAPIESTRREEDALVHLVQPASNKSIALHMQPRPVPMQMATPVRSPVRICCPILQSRV